MHFGMRPIFKKEKKRPRYKEHILSLGASAPVNHIRWWMF